MAVDPSHQPDYPSTADRRLGYVDGTKRFSVLVDQRNPAILVVYVAGEIDLLAEPSLQDHLSKLLANRPECLIIDLHRVSFMGAAGLSALVKAWHTGVQQGTTLKLRSPSRSVSRVLKLAGLDRLFEALPMTEQTGHSTNCEARELPGDGRRECATTGPTAPILPDSATT
jgi:anti-sigma B factor antagonist